MHATTFTFARDPLDFLRRSKDSVMLFRNPSEKKVRNSQTAMRSAFSTFLRNYSSPQNLRAYILSRTNFHPLYSTIYLQCESLLRRAIILASLVRCSLSHFSYSSFLGIFILIYDCLLFTPRLCNLRHALCSRGSGHRRPALYSRKS